MTFVKKRPAVIVTSVLGLILSDPAAALDIDWRANGFVTPVRDSGQTGCGISAAYAAVGHIESLRSIQGFRLVGLSVQQILDCSAVLAPGSCADGPELVFQHVIDIGGIQTEQAYPVKQGPPDAVCSVLGAGSHQDRYTFISPKEDNRAITLVADGDVKSGDVMLTVQSAGSAKRPQTVSGALPFTLSASFPAAGSYEMLVQKTGSTRSFEGGYCLVGMEAVSDLKWVKNVQSRTEVGLPFIKSVPQNGSCSFEVNSDNVEITGFKVTQNVDEGDLLTMLKAAPVVARLKIGKDGAILPEFKNYSGGIFESSDCDDSVVQWVEVIGYRGSDSPPNWVVKNSWGNAWNEAGYIRIKAGVNTCGIADKVYSEAFK
ncbi:hypothetical protein EYC87_08335 [Halieaceae bacterium IMCC8485]|uniref:Peptidase C1A papain C-terminal domain-containing protein n=1 Tax=Candidatus Seongchinamella marina TaxID=2518990 RepID=A0ABT3SUB4_9GAMM|nr:C1 family peptidase [Candidatus Seongchinamella marina]MCX2973585.1 hypothetical protein [Candidatus Seongchinamella marina]